MTNKNTNNPSNATPHRVPVYRRPVFIVGLGIVAIIIIVVIVLLIRNLNKQPEQSSTSPDGSITYQESPSPKPENPDPEEGATEPAGVPQYEGEDPNKLDELTGSIAYSDVDQSSGLLIITASIDQYLQSTGECKLRLLSEGKELYGATLPATADVTTSVCGPFEAPLSELKSGTIKIEITVSADDKTGLITDEIEI